MILDFADATPDELGEMLLLAAAAITRDREHFLGTAGHCHGEMYPELVQ